MDPLYEFDDSDPRFQQLWYQQLPAAAGGQTFQVHDTTVPGVDHHSQNPQCPLGSEEQHHHHQHQQQPHQDHGHHQHQQQQQHQPQHQQPHSQAPSHTSLYHQPNPVTSSPHAATFFTHDWHYPTVDFTYTFPHTYPQQQNTLTPFGFGPLSDQHNPPAFPMVSDDTPMPTTYGPHVAPLNHFSGFSDALSNHLAYSESQAFAASMNDNCSTSDTGTMFETYSPASSESGWQIVNETSPRHSFESDTEAAPPTINYPNQNLHITTPSGSSPSDSHPSPLSPESWEDVPFPRQSPSLTNVAPELPSTSTLAPEDEESPPPRPSRRRQQRPKTTRSKKDSSSTSPSVREKSTAARPSTASSSTKKSTTSLATRKEASSTRKIGKRKGPLDPWQRQQAGQIRKLRACIRCKFLKKTCDVGDPCQGCKPHHVRNWVVPCARIDIKDVSYFMKNWIIDFDRHITPQTTFVNIRNFSPVQHRLWITHGFGFLLPIDAREVWVYDVTAFDVDWWETLEEPTKFTTTTAELSAGENGVSLNHLSDYLDRHLDSGFTRFVREHFDGTPFLTDLLLSSHKYYKKTDNPLVKKALKFVIAYNLTLHITFIEGLPIETNLPGKIDDPQSKYFGKLLAPGMINLQVKFALAKIWRELHSEVLGGLSKLLTGVYSGDKLKNWPTIFVVTALVLLVWEEMQFDTKFRKDSYQGADTFCAEMESVPLGVLVGLFGAVSQKVPAFNEWDSDAHHNVLNSHQPACELMTEVRENVNKHDEYLRQRKDAKFDPQDFDCLSNTFLSKLVIRANN